MIRNSVAIFGGVIIAVIVVMGVEFIGHSLFPVIENIENNSPDQTAEFLARVPIGALLFVPLAWFLGSVCGGLVAVFIAGSRPVMMASIVGGFIFAAAVYVLLAIPHPVWLIVVGIGSIMLSVVITSKIGSRLVGDDTPTV